MSIFLPFPGKFKSNITVMLPEFKRAMIEHALKELPNECCGILPGRNNKVSRVIALKSLNPSPDSYFMDPEQQIEVFSEMEKQGESLIGIYHSHPIGPSHPSDTDLQLAFHHGVIYFIVSLEDRGNPEVNAFKLEKGKFKEVIVDFICLQ